MCVCDVNIVVCVDMLCVCICVRVCLGVGKAIIGWWVLLTGQKHSHI